MAPEEKRPLKAFLCHASGDKPSVRELYKRLVTEGVDAWLDKEKLLPGQDWQIEIPRAVHEADVVVVCLSNKSVTKEGYVQKEIKFALDIAEEKPDGTIFLIPARLEDCIVPERLSRWQWVDLYEENGFIQLLRSLKLRASAIGAVIEAVSYEDTDKERERRLNQLYTEGLEAFYTEDWDRACRRFQAILSEQPNHKNAVEKLEEAQCQGHYAKLYTQAIEAYRSENWVVVIPALEELTQKAPSYKDAAQLLRDARKREQLAEFYKEAKTLHTAQKWQAVVKVFEQISIIEPNYPDADGLLAAAQKEVAELKHIEELNNRYSRALREMNAGHWAEARGLLEQIHKAQTGFLETERLLRKVDEEIGKAEQDVQRNNQVNTLYEQAHGLIRTKNWRKALDKIDEIQKLDDKFIDKDEIAKKAQAELESQEREAQKQNQLAAMYAEAVRLLKEEKYQDALDKWQEVKAIDSKYPDRQWVQRSVRRKLADVRKPVAVQNDFKTGLSRVFEDKEASPSTEVTSSVVTPTRVGWLILFAAIGFGMTRLLQQNLGPLVHIPIPAETGWTLQGFIDGVITALVLGSVQREWRWKSILVFGVVWAVIDLLILKFVLNQQSMLWTSSIFSLAPVLPIFLTSMWVRQRRQWQTYLLIFIGWILAWTIGQSVVGYLDPVFRGASIRWVLCDFLTGGIGLRITIDLLRERSAEESSVSNVVSTPDSKRLFLLVPVSIIIIRAIWGVFQNWFHIWDLGLPTALPFTFQFVLGGCYGAVLAFSLKKILPTWDWRHSLIVITGWALGFGTAVLWGRIGLQYIAGVMALSGLSVAGAVNWANRSVSPLKTTLIFFCWALTWMYGDMLGPYLVKLSGTDYAHCVSDALIVSLGILATYAIYIQTSGRLTQWTILSILGFSAMIIGTMIIASPVISDMYDDFNDPAFAGRINNEKWNYSGDIGKISQENGTLLLAMNGFNKLLTLAVVKNYNPVTAPIFIEGRMMVDPNTTKGGTDFGVGFSILDGWSNCSIFAGQGTQQVRCWSHYFGMDQGDAVVDILPGTWHVLRVESYPDTMTFKYIVDGKNIGSYTPGNPALLRNQIYGLRFYLHNWGTSALSPVSYLDDVKIGTVGR